jgi:uncharacterized protein (TIGR00369 family)
MPSDENKDQNPEPELWERMREAAGQIMSGVPYANAIGMSLVDIGRARATAKVDWRADLVGDPETGVIAGGVVTALLDNTCGVAVMAALNHPTSTATLDLRIDYMRPAEPGRTVFATAHCYKVASSVAFVRGVAFEENEDDPIANATAAFMLSSNAGRKLGANYKEPRK